MASTRRILITGANSFSGKALVGHLLKDEANELVISTRDFSYNISGRYRHVACDLRNLNEVKSLVEDTSPDEIYHLAGSSVNDFMIGFESNVLPARNLCETLVSNRISTRVLFIGSAAEYGVVSPEDNPIPETRQTKPVSFYGLTKAWQTALGEMYSRLGANIVIARTFNLSGSGMSDRLFPGRVEKQIAELIRGERKNLEFGSLDGVRDYIDVSDAVICYQKIMEFGSSGEVYNVGSGKPMKVRDLLYKMLEENGISRNLVSESVASGSSSSNVSEIYADISKLKMLEKKY